MMTYGRAESTKQNFGINSGTCAGIFVSVFIRIFTIFFCLWHATSTFAITVFDPVVNATLGANFAKEINNQIETINKHIEQIKKMAEEIDKLNTQITQLGTQIDLIKQTLAEISEDGFNWSNAKSKIDKLETLFDQTHSLAYNAGDVGARFGELFPGYKEQIESSAKQYQTIVDATHSTLKNILQVVGSSAKSFIDDANRLTQLQEEARGVKGHVQALQAGMRIAAEQASQLMMLRQTLIAQINAQVAYYSAEIQKEASREHSLETAIKQGATTAPEIGYSGREIKLPEK